MKMGFVYIMTNGARTLYIGVTSDLVKRVWQHRTGETPGFASRYGLTQLVYYEEFSDIRDAIAREKQLKGWSRAKKIALINRLNPEWTDLGPKILDW